MMAGNKAGASPQFNHEKYERPQMSKRPPYLEVVVTVLVMAFLTLIVVGGFDTRPEGFGQLTMRSE
jgi:hypothetical protein